MEKKVKANRWRFNKKSGRKPLTKEEARYWQTSLSKLLKVGVELEYNLEKQKGTCDKNNSACVCVAKFKPKHPIPNTKECFEQCVNWDNSIDENGDALYPEDGNCEIAKEFGGCNGVMCLSFSKPCFSCSKYDRGCNTCPSLYDPYKEPVQIRKKIAGKLQPTKFVGDFGKKGVYQVVKDGSLNNDGGVEVVTVGRRPEFSSLKNMLKEIMDLCEENGAYVDERCSVHIHLLASYLKKDGPKGDMNSAYLAGDLSELEKPVPEIILANFHQLFRKYQNAFIWMTSSGTNSKSLTRWERFRKPVTPFSALRHRMETIKNKVGESCYKPKYSIVNYQPLEFDTRGDVKTLHIEARYSDGMLSPSVVAAQAVLIYGLMLKAVELSKHGTLITGTKDEIKLQKTIYSKLCNTDEGWGGPRVSNTSELYMYYETLISQSKELIRLVKSTLSNNHPCDDILNMLAEKPVSLRRIDGDSWEKIESDLNGSYEKQKEPEEVTEIVDEIIDTTCISGCENIEQWLQVVAMELNKGPEEDLFLKVSQVKNIVESYISLGEINWSENSGTFVRRMQ